MGRQGKTCVIRNRIGLNIYVTFPLMFSFGKEGRVKGREEKR